MNEDKKFKFDKKLLSFVNLECFKIENMIVITQSWALRLEPAFAKLAIPTAEDCSGRTGKAGGSLTTSSQSSTRTSLPLLSLL